MESFWLSDYWLIQWVSSSTSILYFLYRDKIDHESRCSSEIVLIDWLLIDQISFLFQSHAHFPRFMGTKVKTGRVDTTYHIVQIDLLLIDPINQSIDQSINQSINISIYQSFNHSINQSINQQNWTNHSFIDLSFDGVIHFVYSVSLAHLLGCLVWFF